MNRDNVAPVFYTPPSIIITGDSYKDTHWLQDPAKTEYKRGYICARESKYPETMMFGMQYIMNQLCKPLTREDVEYAHELHKSHFGTDYFYYEGWMGIVDKFDGRLPLRIKSVLEGESVPVGNILAWIENTVPGYGWLTQFIETKHLKVWAPISVASLARRIRIILKRYLVCYTDLSPADLEAKLNFMFLNFGDRGAYCDEAAMIAGMSHLAAGHMGTDSKTGIKGCRDYYFENMAGYSAFATEHSTMTVRGKAGEVETCREMLQKTKGQICSLVGDSWDIYNFAENVLGGALKTEIEQHGAPVMCRPDSGSVTEVPQDITEILLHKFGHARNSFGLGVLPPYIRVLQGDGIREESVSPILDAAIRRSQSPENYTLGCGGMLVQAAVNRDTYNFADKACSATINGVDIKMSKSPVTQSMKKSREGFLDLRKIGTQYKTINLEPDYGKIDGNIDKWLAVPSSLHTVFENGHLKNVQALNEIRTRAKI